MTLALIARDIAKSSSYFESLTSNSTPSEDVLSAKNLVKATPSRAAGRSTSFSFTFSFGAAVRQTLDNLSTVSSAAICVGSDIPMRAGLHIIPKSRQVRDTADNLDSLSLGDQNALVSLRQIGRRDTSRSLRSAAAYFSIIGENRCAFAYSIPILCSRLFCRGFVGSTLGVSSSQA